MGDERRKPGWAYWLTVALVASPMLYVASFGPACWIAARTGVNESRLFTAPYTPLWWAINRRIAVVAPGLTLYAVVGLPHGGKVMIPSQEGDWWENIITMP